MPHNLMLALKVNFYTRSFQDFTLYDNKITLNIASLLEQQTRILAIWSTKLMIRILKRGCDHVIISS